MQSNVGDASLLGDEDIFASDTDDEALERAAANDSGQAITWMYCTNDWYCRF